MPTFSDPDAFQCPECKVQRPDEPHLDWCTYDGPEGADDDE